MGIYRVEQARELMTKNFPKCPICKSNKGYEVWGIKTNYIQCKSCKAKWRATIEFTRGGHKGINNLTLWRPDKDGKTVPLIGKKYPISFWRLLTPEKLRIEKKFQTKKKLIQKI